MLGVPYAYRGLVMMLLSSVTAPTCASALPSSDTPVVIVIEAYAIIVPLKTEVVPRVAELPTTQKMLLAWAPPVSMIWLPVRVVRVDAIWKTQTALEFPCASRVRPPVTASDDVDL